jgi:hypothetical protein
MRSDLEMVARATEREDIASLRAIGGEQIRIVQPEFEGGIEMARQALDYCHHKEPIEEVLDTIRAQFHAA